MHHVPGFAAFIETAADAPAGSVRIIQTASVAARGGRISLDDLDSQRGLWMGGWGAYSNVKLANVIFIKELARRLQGTGVEAYSFHPGFVRTSFGAGGWAISTVDFLTHGHYGISAEQGAEPRGWDSERTGQFIQAESAKWHKVIQAAKVTME